MPQRKAEHHNGSGNWVEKLHTRSWEMELLIVGFALLVLLKVPDYLTKQIAVLQSQSSSKMMGSVIWLAVMLVVGAHIMKFNLIIHLLLRGYWIGVIGLNSVYSKGINFERLAFAPKFKDFLTQRIQSLQDSALSIDKICSGIFAFTFLLIFMFISVGLFFAVFATVISFLFLLVSWLPIKNDEPIRVATLSIIGIPYFIAGLLMAINFLSLGWFKKIKTKWFSNLFFHISRFFRLVTLSFLYESIYYTLISNISKKVIGVILLTYIVVINLYWMVNYNEDIFNPRQNVRSEFKLSSIYYENKHTDVNVITLPTIQSDVIRDKHIELFIPYDITDSDSILKIYPEIKTFRKRGFSQGFSIVFGTSDTSSVTFGPNSESNISDMQKTLSYLSDFYIVAINDSVYRNLKYYFYEHPNQQEPGLFAYISTVGLNNGNNLLAIRKNKKYKSQAEMEKDTHYIPFWLE